MGILDGILGGGESTSVQNPAHLFGPQGNFLAGHYYPELTKLFKNTGFNLLEQQGQQGALDVAGGLQAGAIDPAFAALRSLFSAPDPNSEIVQNAISGATAPLKRTFQNVIAPNIRRSSGAAGQPGGSRGTIATRLAGEDLLNQVGNISSQIALNANQQGLNAAQGGISLLPQLFQSAFTPSNVQQQIGGAQRTQPLDFMRQIQQLFGPPIVLGGGGSSSGSSSPGIGGLFNFTKVF